MSEHRKVIGGSEKHAIVTAHEVLEKLKVKIVMLIDTLKVRQKVSTQYIHVAECKFTIKILEQGVLSELEKMNLFTEKGSLKNECNHAWASDGDYYNIRFCIKCNKFEKIEGAK